MNSPIRHVPIKHAPLCVCPDCRHKRGERFFLGAPEMVWTLTKLDVLSYVFAFFISLFAFFQTWEAVITTTTHNSELSLNEGRRP